MSVAELCVAELCVAEPCVIDPCVVEPCVALALTLASVVFESSPPQLTVRPTAATTMIMVRPKDDVTPNVVPQNGHAEDSTRM